MVTSRLQQLLVQPRLRQQAWVLAWLLSWLMYCLEQVSLSVPRPRVWLRQRQPLRHQELSQCDRHPRLLLVSLPLLFAQALPVATSDPVAAAAGGHHDARAAANALEAAVGACDDRGDASDDVEVGAPGAEGSPICDVVVVHAAVVRAEVVHAAVVHAEDGDDVQEEACSTYTGIAHLSPVITT